MMNENEIIKAEIPFYYSNFSLRVRESKRMIVNSHQIDQLCARGQ